MKKVSEMYKLYRELPLFQTLYAALLDLAESGDLPVHLIPAVVNQYDQAAVDAVTNTDYNIYFSGTLKNYRIIADHSWFLMSDVTFYLSKPRVSALKQKKKKSAKKPGKRLFKTASLKIWAHNPVSDQGVIIVDAVERGCCPYTVQVEKLHNYSKKVAKNEVKSTVKPLVGYNPLIHAMMVGRQDQIKIENIGKDQDWRRPMPYNEKLRRAKGEDEFVALGISQLGQVEVLKGRWRKRPKEWPHRCVESEERRIDDLEVVSGKEMADRKYNCLLRGQDRDLAELAISATGTLALTAHNIHVVEGGTDVEPVRGGYGTRRKNKIELTSYDTNKNFEIVKYKKLRRRSPSCSTCSSSSEEDVLEEVREGRFWGKFVKSIPRPKSKLLTQAIPIVEIDNDEVEDRYLSFLDDLVGDDDKGNVKSSKECDDAKMEELLLEQVSLPNENNNKILNEVQCKDEEINEDQLDVAIVRRNDESQDFCLDLFTTDLDLDLNDNYIENLGYIKT